MKCCNCKYNTLRKEDGEQFTWCVKKCDNLDINEERQCEWFEPATNVDKYFRNATDEEVAELLVRGCMYVIHDDENRCIKYDCRCKQCWLDWLKQEVKE